MSIVTALYLRAICLVFGWLALVAAGLEFREYGPVLTSWMLASISAGLLIAGNHFSKLIRSDDDQHP